MQATLQSDEIYRRTDNILKNITEQYNPALRLFINAGKAYEKSVAATSSAARQYYDAMTKVGIVTSESMGSKDLGESVRQISESMCQIQAHYEDTIKFMSRNVLQALESKLEQDGKYMVGMYRKYQTESKLRMDDVDKTSATVRKVQKKNNSVRKSTKYDDKERTIIDEMKKKQHSLARYMHDSLKLAFIEERRRYCFFVEQQCDFMKQTIDYHQKSSNTLSTQLSDWQDSCAEVKMLPPSALAILDMCKPLSLGDNISITSSDSILSGNENMNGYDHGNTMPSSINSSNNNNNQQQQHNIEESKTMPRPTPTPSKDASKENRKRVSALFNHNATTGSSQLSFEENDEIILLIPQPRDGWHYGENSRSKQRGWFPYSYTKMIEQMNTDHSQLPPNDLAANMPLPPADYNGQKADVKDPVSPVSSWPPPPAQPQQPVDPYKQMKDQLLMGNPFANVELKKTKTNDLSPAFSTFQ